MRKLLPAAIFAALAPVVAEAASPTLARVSPPGGQRGTEVELAFEGNRLVDPKEILFYDKGFEVVSLKPAEKNGDKRVIAKVRIAPDARMGEHFLRLRTATGVSDLRPVYVGAMPVTNEAEPNTDFKSPQKVELNTTITGNIAVEDMDFYVVELKKGQRLTAEIEAMRLGHSILDAYVAILDEKRFELASSDDSVLAMQDAVASVVAPADGKYIIQVREASYGGDGGNRYRLHVGTFPRPQVAYPPGGQVGQQLSLQFLGDPAGPLTQSVALPKEPQDKYPVFAEQDGLIAPSPNFIRVSPFPSVNESEPNENTKTATAAPGAVPVAFNGILAGENDADYYKFTAKKGQSLDVHVYARRLRSPLDSVMTIVDAAGKNVANNDDTGGPDSFARFTVPADGEYFVRIRDHLRGGSPTSVYRIEVTPTAPSVQLAIPQMQRDSQDRQAIAVPRGGRYGATFRVTRNNVAGDLQLVAGNLPAGVTMTPINVQPNADVIPVLFEATADAPLAGALVDLKAKPADGKTEVTGGYNQMIELLYGPNQTSFLNVYVDRLATVVGEAAPFDVEIVPPRVPLVQQGSMNLKVKVARKGDFKGPVTVRLLYNPPGVTSSAAATIAADKTEGVLTLNTTAAAPVRDWDLAVTGTADVAGPLWIASAPAKVTVAAPMLAMKIPMSNVEQNGTGTLTAEIEQKVKFDGKAKVHLRGLPANVTVEPVEITSADTKATFTLKAGPKAPLGQHKSVFCYVEIPQDGETIVHNVGQGGVIRIDPAPKSDKSARPTTQPVKITKADK